MGRNENSGKSMVKTQLQKLNTIQYRSLPMSIADPTQSVEFGTKHWETIKEIFGDPSTHFNDQ
jgi:hypothetical protein